MVEKVFDTLYTLDSRKKIRVFECEVARNETGAGITTRTGLLGGKLISKIEVVKKGKNLDKNNATPPLSQALLQADSLWRNKWLEGYKSAKVIKEYTENKFGVDLYAFDGITELNEKEISKLLVNIPEASQTNGDWEYLPQLATKYKDQKKNIIFPIFVQPKLNGVRCMARGVGAHVRLISRGGTYYQIPHIQEQLQHLLFNEPNLLLDGELYRHNANLQDISGAARKAEEGMFQSNNWLEYHIYDVINLDNLGETEILREQNRLGVGIMLKTELTPHIRVVKSLKALDHTEIKECHDQFVEEGYEGCILRQQNGMYEFNNRSKNLIKVKEFQDAEFEIVGCEVDPNKSIGESFVFTLKNDINDLVFRARPTGSIEQKQIWYENIESYIGDKATLRFQERSKDGLPIQGHVRSDLTEVLHIRPDFE